MVSRQSGIGPGRDANLRPLYRAIIVLSLCLSIRAQGVEDASCPSLFLLSPTGANPCKSLVNVMTACTGAMPLILPLNQQPLGLYGPPTGDATTLGCECTEVVYNLYSACAACQNGNDTTNWYSNEQWFRTCPQNRENITINSNEIVNWNNFTYQPTFDVPTALAIAQGLPPPPHSSSTTTASTGSVAQGGTDAAPNSASIKSSKSNTGAIVGGVVGGVAFLMIIGLVLFCCVRKRKSRRVPPSAEFMKYAQAQGINNATVPLTHMGQTEDDPRSSQSHGHGQGQGQGSGYAYGNIPGGRNSVLNANSSTRSPSALGVSRNNTTEEDAPPAFTTGLFKDPIFEKGVALNLAGASAASGGPASASPTGPNPLTQTPVTYSPASTLYHPENQRLIHGRQMSS